MCVVNGIKKRLDFEEFKYLTAPMATSGSVALCHIVGTTPEAQSLEQAFGPKKALEKITIGTKEMKEMWRKLNTTDQRMSIWFSWAVHIFRSLSSRPWRRC